MNFNLAKFPVGFLTFMLGCALAIWMIWRPEEKLVSSDASNSSGSQPSTEETREHNGKSSQRSANFPRHDVAKYDEVQSIEDLARRDHHAAILRLDSLSDPELRSLALAAIAKGWAESDHEGAGAWVAKLELENDAISAALGLIPAWVAVNPNRCMGWATSLAVGNLRDVSLAQLADAWVSVDPQKAVSSYFALKPEPGSESGLHVIVSQWVLDSPEAAMKYFTNDNDMPRREEFLETALVSLTNKNPTLVWSRATTGFTDPARILNVRAMALEAISETNPGEAIRLAESVGNDPELLRGIARGWSYMNEAEAKEWINGMTDSELAKSLMHEVSPQ